jgi:V/A-type H+-transporting ATPase subunit A
VESLSRLKSQVKNDDTASLSDFEQGMRAALQELESSYKNKETS